MVSADKWAKECKLEDGKFFAWRKIEKKDTALFDPEVIHTVGSDRWQEDKAYYFLLLTSLNSRKAQSIRYLGYKNAIAAVYLNGEKQGGKLLQLNKGDNQLLLLYYSGRKTYSPQHYGAFFRLLEENGEERVSNVAYRPEKIEFTEKKSVISRPAVEGSQKGRVIDDFEDGDVLNLCGVNSISDADGAWYTVCDEHGETKMSPPAVEEITDGGKGSKRAFHSHGFLGTSRSPAE